MKRLIVCAALCALASACAPAATQQSPRTAATTSQESEACETKNAVIKAEKDTKRRYELIKQLPPECV